MLPPPEVLKGFNGIVLLKQITAKKDSLL